MFFSFSFLPIVSTLCSFFFCSTTARITDNKIIKNIHIPSCKNCIHYNPSVLNRDFASPTNECHKFGEKDIITDKITYTFAENARNDETKCGKGGVYFQQDPHIDIKIFKHSIIRNLGYGIVFIFVSLCLK